MGGVHSCVYFALAAEPVRLSGRGGEDTYIHDLASGSQIRVPWSHSVDCVRLGLLRIHSHLRLTSSSLASLLPLPDSHSIFVIS